MRRMIRWRAFRAKDGRWYVDTFTSGRAKGDFVTLAEAENEAHSRNMAQFYIYVGNVWDRKRNHEITWLGPEPEYE